MQHAAAAGLTTLGGLSALVAGGMGRSGSLNTDGLMGMGQRGMGGWAPQGASHQLPLDLESAMAAACQATNMVVTDQELAALGVAPPSSMPRSSAFAALGGAKVSGQQG